MQSENNKFKTNKTKEVVKTKQVKKFEKEISRNGMFNDQPKICVFKNLV